MHTSLLPLSRDARRNARRRALAACLLAAALMLGASIPAPSSRATAAAANVLTVTNTNDSGPGSLRQAIANAAPNDAINFNLPAGSTILLTSGELFVNKNLEILGPAAAALTVSALGGSHRVFRVASGATVRISGLTLYSGFASALSDPVNLGGGGVHNAGTLTLAGCVIADSRAVDGVVGGGIYNSGALTLTDTIVARNTARGAATVGSGGASAAGGGIFNGAGATLVLNGSTVTLNVAQGGSASPTGSAGSGSGGGIYNLGTLTMTNSLVSDNVATGMDSGSAATAGGGGSGGGVENFGTLTADRCSVLNNTAQSGFAPANPAPAQGGGINNLSTATLTNSTVGGNRALAGGANADGTPAAARGGGVNNFSTATLTNSTVSGNISRGGHVANNNAGGTAGGADALGGGVNSAGSVTLVNSTVSGNEAQGGIGRFSGGPGSPGGKASGGGIFAEGTLALTNCTVTLNAAAGGRGASSSAEGGGVLFRGSGTASPLNTIVAANFVRGNSEAANPSDAPDVSGTFASQGHNLVGRNEGAAASFPAGTPNASGDIVGTRTAPVNAVLGPLVNNGGPTQTHRPWPGSPAIEAGDNVVLGPPHNLTTDQRGAGFARLVNANVDIGAVEARNSVSTFNLFGLSGSVSEGGFTFRVFVTRTGALEVGDFTVDVALTEGTASSRSDFKPVFATLRFASGEESKNFTYSTYNDAYDEQPDETIAVTLSNPTGGAALGADSAGTIVIGGRDVPDAPNPVDVSSDFVRHHYIDFLGREPDSLGLQFWQNEIEQCGADAACREVKRVNVSAAFFLSIEFQETGFFALRARRAAFSNNSAFPASRVTFQQFLRDTQELAEEVVVGAAGWPQRLEQNRLGWLARMVETPAFRARYPVTVTPAVYVDMLFARAGVTPTAAEKEAAINAYGWGGTAGRAAALGSVAESASVKNAEFNPAFVLMQYFGYLRRNPTDPPDSNDAGYQFWLAKLNQAGGDYIAAEMVKAFISSAEYRQRFGPQ